jgi:hypothetical protein
MTVVGLGGAATSVANANLIAAASIADVRWAVRLAVHAAMRQSAPSPLFPFMHFAASDVNGGKSGLSLRSQRLWKAARKWTFGIVRPLTPFSTSGRWTRLEKVRSGACGSGP